MEEALQGEEVPVVGVVECGRGLEVERSEAVVATGRGALLPAQRREAGVDVGIVVDVVAEVEASRLADGVRAGERGQVASA
ncbi:hypothetical protein C4D60_Mb07t19760 [Musa balbisiana]|uniref:Uncharacterized protein n=1 Tax=Musa balbisiana TaxID=52838 RepID=A0A4S8JII6_MUSBA|nr:hypothetical protein C4D60_Mb07t19760 [Musa balbisiana]